MTRHTTEMCPSMSSISKLCKPFTNIRTLLALVRKNRVKLLLSYAIKSILIYGKPSRVFKVYKIFEEQFYQSYHTTEFLWPIKDFNPGLPSCHLSYYPLHYTDSHSHMYHHQRTERRGRKLEEGGTVIIEIIYKAPNNISDKFVQDLRKMPLITPIVPSKQTPHFGISHPLYSATGTLATVAFDSCLPKEAINAICFNRAL